LYKTTGKSPIYISAIPSLYIVITKSRLSECELEKNTSQKHYGSHITTTTTTATFI